jgi:hypothetical protein
MMSRVWLSILSQAGVIVVFLGAFWLFLQLYTGDVPDRADWVCDVVGLMTLLFACMALWAVKQNFAPPSEQDKVE